MALAEVADEREAAVAESQSPPALATGYAGQRAASELARASGFAINQWQPHKFFRPRRASVIQLERISDQAIGILEGDELPSSVGPTAHFHGGRRLAVEEPIEDAGGVGLDGSGGSFSRRGVAEDHVLVVAYVAPDGAALDVLQARGIEHLEPGGVGAPHVGVAEDARRQAVERGSTRPATPATQSARVETGMVAPFRSSWRARGRK